MAVSPSRRLIHAASLAAAVRDLHQPESSLHSWCGLWRRPEPGEWVQLQEPLEPMSSGEALLLCERSHNVWLAWVPDYGEIALSLQEFCPASP